MTQSSSSDVDTTISVYLRSKLNPDALNKWLIFKKKMRWRPPQRCS